MHAHALYSELSSPPEERNFTHGQAWTHFLLCGVDNYGMDNSGHCLSSCDQGLVTTAQSNAGQLGHHAPAPIYREVDCLSYTDTGPSVVVQFNVTNETGHLPLCCQEAWGLCLPHPPPPQKKTAYFFPYSGCTMVGSSKEKLYSLQFVYVI